ncbi:MAG: hypothetical protein JNK58_07340 [Phycisphaerae bacterium]|nr:hypothetical protein [Phycisphaerae bacterium]
MNTPLTHESGFTPRPQHHPRRGVAMILVLIALGVGVVLAGVAITSRQPAAQIGKNACDDAAARWGAHAAAGCAEAILQSEADGVSYANAKTGELVRNFSIEGGTANVRLTRLDGSTPQPGDRELLMTAVATVGSMTATVQKRVSLANPVPLNIAADARLAEFAVFAGNSLTVETDSVIAPSPYSTEPDSLVPIKIGTGFSSAAALNIDGNAKLRRTALFTDNNASLAMDAALTDAKYYDGTRLPYTIPLIREKSPPEVATLPILSIVLPLLNGVTQTLTQGNYSALTIQNGAVVTLGQVGAKTVYKFTNITVESSGVLRFAGDVIVQASGATIVRTFGAIEPATADSRIEFYLGRNVTLTDCAIGLNRTIARDSSRAPKDAMNHPLADQVYLSTLNTADGGSAAPAWTINSRAMILASIYAPQSTLTIDGESALIGRAVCGAFTLRGRSQLLYDTRLDPRAGFTELAGPLYLDRLPIPPVTTYLGSVAPATGAEAYQTALKSTLDTYWSALSTPNLLVRPVAAAPAAWEDELIADDSAATVIVAASGTPSPRVQGKARFRTQAQRAEGYEN